MDEITEYNIALKVCSELLKEIRVEFVGVALQNEMGPDVRWHCCAGNLNDKYKRITVRYGKGIAGRVISSGSPMMIKKFPEELIGKSTDYPIMLAEKLISSYAVPIFFSGIPKGVLLVGTRAEHHFTDEDFQLVRKSADYLEGALKII